MTLAIAAMGTACSVVILVFLVLFATERWWKHEFGQSVMILTVALALIVIPIALHRWIGDYRGHNVVLLIGLSGALIAMSQRTFVLLRARRRRGEDV